MQALRNSKLIARLTLAWFALFIASAIASPIIKPSYWQMVCSASGPMKLVDAAAGNTDEADSGGMHCPLCLGTSLAAPPPTHPAKFAKPSSLAHALQPVAAAHIASVTAPPLPSRGPPAFSL